MKHIFLLEDDETLGRGIAMALTGAEASVICRPSLAKAREIADLLKSWIQKGEFLLTEPVRPMPVQASLNGLKAIED